MKNNKISLIVYKMFSWVVIMSLSISSVFAQPEDLPDAPIDEPGAPIDGYVWILALVGMFIVFMKLRSIMNNKIQN